MNDQGSIAEISDLVVGALPVDLNTAGATGLWFNMRGCDGVNAIFIGSIGTAGDDPIITLEQAQDASSGGAKALNIKRIDYKVGTGGAAIAAATDRWQRVAGVDRDNPVASYDTDPIAGAENGIVVACFILPNDLDVANNFTHIRMKVADVGANAQLGTIIYIPSGRWYKGAHNASHLS